MQFTDDDVVEDEVEGSDDAEDGNGSVRVIQAITSSSRIIRFRNQRREKNILSGVIDTMALKNEKVPVPKQVQKRYKQDQNRYRKQIQKLQKMQAGHKAA
jgi:hypothetical protein